MNEETAQMISKVKEKLTAFSNHAFDNVEGQIIAVGTVLGQKEAINI